MRKRELLNLKPLPVTKKMREAAGKRVKTKRYMNTPVMALEYPWLYRVKKVKEVLQIDVFTSDWIEEGIEEPRYRIFLQEEKFETYDNLSQKWRKSTVEKLECGDGKRKYCDEHVYSQNKIWIEDKERQTLKEYLENGIENPRSAIQVWQNGQRHRSEMDRIDQEMNIVPEMPKDFKEWVLKEAADQYIFYDAGRKVKEGYCTHCERTVQIKEPRYNKEGACPHCRHKVTYKSRKKAGNMSEEDMAGLLQRTKEGYVYRAFSYLIRYQNGKRVCADIWESGRMTLDENLRERNLFIFGRWKYTDLERWKYDDGCGFYYASAVAERSCKALYWRNLKKVLKGSRLQYSALDLYARNVRRINVGDFIYRFGEYQEKLIKCGFFHLAKGSKRDINYLDKTASKCKKILDLRGDYYKVIAGKNPTVAEYYKLHQMQENGIRTTWEDIKYFAEVIPNRNIAIYIRHTTLHKMKRYLREALKHKHEDILEYCDYLEMAERLGYDLQEEYVLFPRDMKQRHDLMVEESREKEEKIKQAKDSEKNRIFLETVEKNGWKEYEMESEGLFIKVPESIEEIRKEGHTLHHCVSTYINRVAAGKTCILLIRKKEEPKQPFYTMEVDKGTVIQCKGKNNKDMTEEVSEFVKEFKRKKLRSIYRERKAG